MKVKANVFRCLLNKSLVLYFLVLYFLVLYFLLLDAFLLLKLSVSVLDFNECESVVEGQARFRRGNPGGLGEPSWRENPRLWIHFSVKAWGVA